MEHWWSFAYQYLVGGAIFLVPIYLGVKKGALNPKRSLDKRLIVALVGAYLIYFSAQGIWNIFAIASRGY